jgi:hypothetical protein
VSGKRPTTSALINDLTEHVDLLIVGRKCGLSVSKRRFHSVSFPGLKGNSTAKYNRLLDCEQIPVIAAYNSIDSKSGHD